MVRRSNAVSLVLLLSILCSCATVHQIKELPAGTYVFSRIELQSENKMKIPAFPVGTKAEVMLTDSALILDEMNGVTSAVIPYRQIGKLELSRSTLDIDILTIPFKVRPSVEGFPEQLNSNFSAALYFGSRKDFYQIRNASRKKRNSVQVTGLGFGYGGFLGVGAVTMNEFVTRQKINSEYDGFVITAGLASIYDIKKINLGLALGIDHLVDKNRHYWIYQNKPWFGILFGLNLN